MYQVDAKLDADTILSDLLSTVEKFNDDVYTYLHHPSRAEVFNPLGKLNIRSINGPKSLQYFRRLGIRRVVLNARPDKSLAFGSGTTGSGKIDTNRQEWETLKDYGILEEFKAIFRSCDIIQFEDWAGVVNASDYWDGLLSDVIRPLGERSFQFIFYLGNTSKKYVFEIDEILDIISEYTSYGKTTLVLAEKQAHELLSTLHLGSAIQRRGTTGEYEPIFNTMNIDALVIFSQKGTKLLSGRQRLELPSSSLSDVKDGDVRDCYDAGYQLGLLFQLSIPHSISLGLVISEAYAKNRTGLNEKTLMKYIKEWVAGLKIRPTTTEKNLQGAPETNQELVQNKIVQHP